MWDDSFPHDLSFTEIASYGDIFESYIIVTVESYHDCTIIASVKFVGENLSTNI